MTNEGVFHREIFGGLLEDSTSAVARHLFQKWIDISRVRTPCYGDFLPDSNPRVGENMMILAPTESGDFVYVGVGSATMRLVGRDLTGKAVSSVDGTVIRYAETIYRRVFDTFVPAHCIFAANFRAIVDQWERIILPVRLSHEGGPTFLLLYSEPLNFRASMLEHALEAVENAIICTRPVNGSSGRVTDAWINFANRAARNLFDIQDDHPGRLVRQLPILFNDDVVWTRLTDPRPLEPRTIWHKHFGTQADYMISSRLSADHLIFSVMLVGGEQGDIVWV